MKVYQIHKNRNQNICTKSRCMDLNKKLKDSKHEIEKIIKVINKMWKIIQKQIMDPHQRRTYFDKNSNEELELK